MIQRGRKSIAQRSAMEIVSLQTAPDPRSPDRNFPPPPPHLSEEMQAWWTRVVRGFSLNPHHLKTLQTAAESWDLKEEARVAISEHGLSYTDEKGMIRARPEVAIERDAKTSFLRAVRELGLDAVPKKAKVGGIGWMPPDPDDDRTY